MQKTAIVTGGSRGIGRGICLGLAAQSWAVVVNYRGNADAAQEAAALVEQAGGQALIVQADIGLTGDRERLVQATLDRFGRIDLLVNNAGMAPRLRADLLETSEESYDEVMAVNLKGPFFLTQRVAQAMIAQSRGIAPSPTVGEGWGGGTRPAIINIGSISAYTASVNRGEYCISKAGMGMMTALFADRLASHAINVYEVRPGIIETDMTSGVKAKYDALIGDGLTPIRRWGQPADIAAAVVALAEGSFPFSTGEIFNVDGGFHLRRL
ncbi:MAG: 3-ketoacyl-ACP reductase [Chloroflexi bacterium]|nr:MAG: 3-ketoacyl-ACP reductase [Chloroflexota bacterium]